MEPIELSSFCKFGGLYIWTLWIALRRSSFENSRGFCRRSTVYDVPEILLLSDDPLCSVLVEPGNRGQYLALPKMHSWRPLTVTARFWKASTSRHDASNLQPQVNHAGFDGVVDAQDLGRNRCGDKITIAFH